MAEFLESEKGREDRGARRKGAERVQRGGREGAEVV